MTQYSWTQIRNDTIDAWGSTPQGQLEADILETFQHSPALVVATINKTTASYKAGRITSPWAILRHELQKATSPERTPTVTDTTEKTKAIAHAEQWVRATGLHYPNENEVLAHLFGIEEQTPPVEYLEQLEIDTRGRPGRPLYEGLLKATIQRTKTHGTQPVPGSADGPLAKYRTTQVRDQILKLYREVRPVGLDTEAEEHERAAHWLRTRKAVLTRPLPDEPIIPQQLDEAGFPLETGAPT